MDKTDKKGIQSGEFADKGLTSIKIPEGIVSIGYDAYRNNKIKELVIPNSVTEIGYQAFAENAIESLKLSENLIVIQKSAFSNNKIKTLVIPESVKIIYRTAFQYNKITKLFLPETVREIWTGAFYGNRITKITIGHHVNTIEGEYDDFHPSGTFGGYGANFLSLYNKNGRQGGVYTYSKNQECWSFKAAPLSANSRVRIWSDKTLRYTEQALQDLEFGIDPETKNVCLKREDRSYGYIELKDALNRTYRVISRDGRVEVFQSVYDLTKAGWALD
jgi:hypothetical protein